MAATEATTLVDAGTCRWCPHGQWSHKRGKGGCRELDCICDKYEPPKGKPAAAPVLEVNPASPVAGEVVDGPDAPGPLERVGEPEPAGPGDVELTPAMPEPTRAELVADLTTQSIELGTYDLVVPAAGKPEPTCAYPAGEDQGEHDHAMCEDVVAERDEIRRLRIWLTRTQGERDEAVVRRDQAIGEAEEAQRRADTLAGELRSLEAETTAVTAQRDQAVADLAKLGKELTAARREAKAATRAKERIRDELDAATRARLRLQEELDEAILTGLSAVTAVLYRYAAWQCETCGSRYSKRTRHEHPLTAVDVLIVRREAS